MENKNDTQLEISNTEESEFQSLYELMEDDPEAIEELDPEVAQ